MVISNIDISPQLFVHYRTNAQERRRNHTNESEQLSDTTQSEHRVDPDKIQNDTFGESEIPVCQITIKLSTTQVSLLNSEQNVEKGQSDLAKSPHAGIAKIRKHKSKTEAKTKNANRKGHDPFKEMDIS